MSGQIPLSLHVALHNLINLHLFPNRGLRLSQYDNCDFADAKVIWERTGNPFDYGKYAHTYHYRIIGEGFDAQLRAIWADEDQATAEITVLAITPDDDKACAALQDWLDRTVTGRRPRRDLNDGFCPH